MRLTLLLCVGCVLVGTVGCSERPPTGVTPTDLESEVSSEGEDVPGAGFLRGLFTYMADAAVFQDCADGRRYPVAMEAGYLELERAYLDQRVEPGAPLLVVIRGFVEKRPPMEGDVEVDSIVVEEYEAAFPEDDCGGERIESAFLKYRPTAL